MQRHVAIGSLAGRAIGFFASVAGRSSGSISCVAATPASLIASVAAGDTIFRVSARVSLNGIRRAIMDIGTTL